MILFLYLRIFCTFNVVYIFRVKWTNNVNV